MTVLLWTLASGLLVLVSTPQARADRPMPEPILAETTTDIDGTDTGDV